MEFLSANTRNLLDGHKSGDFISAEGKDVLVIGGGDTGTDCVGTAIRQGCKSLLQVEILPKPPLERATNNPWPEWPKIYRQDYGQEDAQATLGDDPRVFCMTARRFIGDERGHLKKVELVQVEWQKDEKGRFVPKEIPGTEKIVPCQLVLLAMGFLGPGGPVASTTRRRARRTLQRQGPLRQVRDEYPGSFCGRRLPSRPKSCRVGVQRRPWRRPRVRPLSDGPHRPALSESGDG